MTAHVGHAPQSAGLKPGIFVNRRLWTGLFLVVYVLAMIVAGVLATAVPQAEVQRMIGEAIGAVLFAVGYTYYTAIIASTYDQLGPVHGAGSSVSPSSPN